MKNIRIYDDGSVDIVTSVPTPLPQTGNFAIIRIPVPDQPAPFDNTVMAAAVSDQLIPIKFGKGSMMPCGAFFNFMRKLMTAPAFKWAVEPHLLWINKRYFQDSFWPGDDPQGNPADGGQPLSECINYPLNFIQYDYRVGDWFHLVSYKNTTPPADPLTDNWFLKSWLWGKAQALSKDGKVVTNVGSGLHVYLPTIKKTVNTWMHLSQLELFPAMPPEGTGWILRGASVFMQTAQGIKALRLARTPGELEHPYPGWKLETRSVIPEVRADWMYP